jgi:hypothetical protein
LQLQLIAREVDGVAPAECIRNNIISSGSMLHIKVIALQLSYPSVMFSVGGFSGPPAQ